MDTKYTNPIKTGTFDEEGNPFTLVNPMPTEVTNFPADYALPVAQLASLNQEATQELIRLLLVSLDGKFNSLGQKASDDSHPVVLSTEQEVILDAIKTAVENLDLDIEDIATEATLLAFKNAFDARDLATETTLLDVESELTTLNTKFNSLGQKLNATSHPVVLSAEQEAILVAIQTATEDASGNLATEATLELVRLLMASLDSKWNTLGQKASAASAPVVLSTEQEVILNAIKTAVENLDLDIEDIATEVTLSSLLTAFNAEDFSSETTLAALLTAFNLEDFASETTLADLNTKLNTLGQKASVASAPVVLSTEQEVILDAIKTAVENLDLDIEEIATETTLASLLAAFNAEDFSTETTLAALLTAFNLEDFASQTTLAALLSAFNAEDFASETTLAAFKAAFDARDLATETTVASIDSKLNTLGQKLMTGSVPVVLASDHDDINVNVTGGAITLPLGAATEAKQDDQITLLTSLDGKDFATETTLAALAAEDFATETTLADLNTKLNTLGQKTSAASAPVVLSSEQEVILNAIKTAVENLDLDIEDIATEVTLAALLTAFNAEDFASETTLAAFQADFNAEDFASETTLADLNSKFNTLGQKASINSHPVVLSTEQEAILDAIKDAVEGSSTGLAQELTLQALLTAFNAEDFASETTLAALRADFNSEDFATETTLLDFQSDFNAEDFATETTLSAFKTAFDSRDLATETTLTSIDGKLNSLGQKTKAGSVPVTLASDQESIKVTDELDGVAAFSTINVGTTAVELKVGASRLAGRRFIHIQPKAQGIFWGYGNTVTTANGTELFKNQIVMLPSSGSNEVWLIGTTGTVDVRIGELG